MFINGIVAASHDNKRVNILNPTVPPLQLTEFDHIPEGLLERPASALYQQLPGPPLMGFLAIRVRSLSSDGAISVCVFTCDSSRGCMKTR